MVTWEQCRGYFEPDGSLRDIYTVGGRTESWRGLLKVLATAAPSFQVDGKDCPVPLTVDEAFAASQEATVVLRATWGGILLCCHFFDPDQVDLDLAPQDVNSDARFAAVLEFMVALARASARNVVLTPENQYDRPLLEVAPSGEVKDVGA